MYIQILKSCLSTLSLCRWIILRIRIIISQYGLAIFIYVAIDKLNRINDCSLKHLSLRKSGTQLRKVQK